MLVLKLLMIAHIETDAVFLQLYGTGHGGVMTVPPSPYPRRSYTPAGLPVSAVSNDDYEVDDFDWERLM